MGLQGPVDLGIVKDVQDKYVAVGGLGTIMISKDGGQNWEKII